MRPTNGSAGIVMALAAGAALTAGGAVPRPAGAPATARPPHQALPQLAAGHRAAARRRLPEFGTPGGHAYVPTAGRAVSTRHPDHVIGNGTPAGCTSAAVIRAVASGGVIVFRCGPHPVTITMTATARVVNTSHRVVLDGGGRITLSGGRKHRILYLDTCDRKQQITSPDCYNQQWPQLIVQNMAFEDGNSEARQTPHTSFGGGGGGAIFDLGGQLRVVNSRFTGNRCYYTGPDLGGAGIRALAQWRGRPVYIVNDTFRGGLCSNGGALSSIGVSWVVLNSLMIGNLAVGFGANPAVRGTPGGGSGGAIYTDGNKYSLTVEDTVIRGNYAREGGGAIFFVSNNNTGTLTIRNCELHNNPSLVFWTRPYPGVYFHSRRRHLTVINSTIN